MGVIVGHYAMSEIRYRLMKPDDADAVSVLVLSSFEEYIASEYTPLGLKEFRKYVSAEALKERIVQDHFVVVASTDDGLAGMLEMRQNNHVVLLFVDKAFHRKGVARALLDHALGEARRRQPDGEHVTVSSSRYGVPAYEKIGFRQTGPERAVNGIVFIPMAMRMETQDS